jgi:hypothetical protein
MNVKTFSDAMGIIDSKYVEEAALYHPRIRRAVPWGKVSVIAACFVFVLALALFVTTFQRQNENLVTEITENEPKVELTLTEAMNDKSFGVLFPQKLLDGYVLQDIPCIYGVGDNAVLKVTFSNEELGDEMVIRIASKEWFHSHEKESTELNIIHYREKLDGTGSYIYFDSGENIISYSFSIRDIAEIDGFWDMVNSAKQITDYSGE